MMQVRNWHLTVPPGLSLPELDNCCVGPGTDDAFVELRAARHGS